MLRERGRRLRLYTTIGALWILCSAVAATVAAPQRGVNAVAARSDAPETIVINEILAHSDVSDAVELLNIGEAPVDIAHIVRNNIYVYGIRGEGKSATHRAEAFMRQKRFDATKIHTHTFALDDLPTALRYAKD